MKASAETTAGRVAVIEHLAPQGAGSPLHVHRREDEWFYVLEGELAFLVGGERDRRAGRLVRLRPARRPAHVRGHLAAGALPARRGARRIRELRARAGPAGGDPHDPAARRRPAGLRAAGGDRGRARRRDPRPARDPGLTRLARGAAPVRPAHRHRGATTSSVSSSGESSTASAAASASSRGRVAAVRQGDHAHPGGLRREDAVRGVLDGGAGRGLDAEPSRRLQVDVRRGLAALDLLRRHGRAEGVARARTARGRGR